MIQVRLFFLRIKHIRGLYYIPLIVMYILLPFIHYIDSRIWNADELPTHIIDTAQMYLPILSAWWTFCVLFPYLDQKGSELLALYEGNGNSKIVFVLCTWVLYIIHASLLFVSYYLIWNISLVELVRLIIQSFFMISSLYMLMYMLNSAPMGLLVVVLYSLIMQVFKEKHFLYGLSIYTAQYSLVTSNIIIRKYLFFLIAGILFLVIGMRNNKGSRIKGNGSP